MGASQRDVRERVASVHGVFDAQKFCAEAAGGMEIGEILRLEAASFQQGNGQGIADRHGYRGAGGGGEIQGTGFFADADVESHVAGFGEGRARLCRIV